MKLLETSNDRTLALARFAVGIVFFAHGAQKVLGWFGGYGFSETMRSFTQTMHIPAVFAVLAIAAEFLGGLGLIVGLLGRIAAFGIAVEMLVAVGLVHAKFGFFMNWSGHQAGEGFEFHILAVAIALTVIAKGSGAWSLDRVLSRSTQRPRTVPRSLTPREERAPFSASR